MPDQKPMIAVTASPATARRALFAAASACLTLAALWHFVLAARFDYRIPRDWKNEMRYVGSQSDADPVTGTLPETEALGSYERRMRVVSDADWPRSVVLRNSYRVLESGTAKVIFEYVTNDTVNPRSGLRIGAVAGDFAVFPRNVEKKTYYLSSNYQRHLPVSFEGTEQVDDIATYVFAYRGRMEYTDAYRGSADYPGVPVASGQEIRCADDKFVFRAWVEPATGEIAQIDEGCPSGDYIFDTASGRRRSVVDRWDGRSEGSLSITNAVRAGRWRYLWKTRYLPGFLVVSGMLFAIAGALRYPRRETA
jgi:hypothetical protein